MNSEGKVYGFEMLGKFFGGAAGFGGERERCDMALLGNQQLPNRDGHR